MDLTEEQLIIINKVVEELKNLIVIAKAGCGKTSTLITAAIAFYERYKDKFPNLQILFLTYNTILRFATCDKIKEKKLESVIQCHTFHSFVTNYYLYPEDCLEFSDALIYKTVFQKKKIKEEKKKEIGNIHLIIVDESEDLILLYVQLLQKLFTDIQDQQQQHDIQIVLCGDPLQQIYTFRKTSLDFMKNPDVYFSSFLDPNPNPNPNPNLNLNDEKKEAEVNKNGIGNQYENENHSCNRNSDCKAKNGARQENSNLNIHNNHHKNKKFDFCYLSYSFRITPPMALFVNKYLNPMHLESAFTSEEWIKVKEELAMWWGTGIHSHKNSAASYEEVEYLQIPNGSWNFHELSLKLKPFYKNRPPHSVSILSYSGKSQSSPVWRLINALSHDYTGPWAYFFNDGGGGGGGGDIKDLAEPISVEGKRIASTIHRYRGHENDVIIFLGFDAYYEKKMSKMALFDLLRVYYVGLTRASQKLIVIQCDKVPFITVRKTLTGSLPASIVFSSSSSHSCVSSPSLPTQITKKTTPLTSPTTMINIKVNGSLNINVNGMKKRKIQPQLQQQSLPNDRRLLNKKQQQKMKNHTMQIVPAYFSQIQRYIQSGLSAENVFSFVPYDPYLNNEMVSKELCHTLTNEDSKETLIVENYIVKGKEGIFQENVYPLYVLALKLALQAICQNLKNVPSLRDVGISVDTLKRDDLKEIFSFLEEKKNEGIFLDDEKNEDIEMKIIITTKMETEISKKKKNQINWELLIQIANAYSCIAQGLLYKWKQLLNTYKNWLSVKFLNFMLSRTLDLLKDVELCDKNDDDITDITTVEEKEREKKNKTTSEYKFYSKYQTTLWIDEQYKISIYGKTFIEKSNRFLFLDTNIHKRDAENPQLIYLFTTLLRKEFKNEMLLKQQPIFVISPFQGCIHRIKIKDNTLQDFMYLSIARKLDLPVSLLRLVNLNPNSSNKRVKKTISDYFQFISSFESCVKKKKKKKN